MATVTSLRTDWERAVENNRPEDALTALKGLQRLEPKEPRWPHRAGETLRRLGKHAEAADAFLRAIELYHTQGFEARAEALAKSVLQLNPSKADLIAEIRAMPTPSGPASPFLAASAKMRAAAPTRPSVEPEAGAKPK
ncbi:MAG TPA: hypothetical protein PLR99_28120, partial [Polyangiaceae bacterium]|nr:hypothetical protein [Polyangiaceae bacterium]